MQTSSLTNTYSTYKSQQMTAGPKTSTRNQREVAATHALSLSPKNILNELDDTPQEISHLITVSPKRQAISSSTGFKTTEEDVKQMQTTVEITQGSEITYKRVEDELTSLIEEMENRCSSIQTEINQYLDANIITKSTIVIKPTS